MMTGKIYADGKLVGEATNVTIHHPNRKGKVWIDKNPTEATFRVRKIEVNSLSFCGMYLVRFLIPSFLPWYGTVNDFGNLVSIDEDQLKASLS